MHDMAPPPSSPLMSDLTGEHGGQSQRDTGSPPTSNLNTPVASNLTVGHVRQSRIDSYAMMLSDVRRGQRSSLNPEIVGGIIKSIDLGLIVVATVAVFTLQSGVTMHPARAVDRNLLALLTSLLAAMLFTAGFQRIGGYKLAQLANLRWQLTRAAALWVMTGSVLLFGELFGGLSGIDPMAWAPGWIVTTLTLLLIERGIVRGVVAQCARQGYLTRNVVIVGAGEQGE